VAWVRFKALEWRPEVLMRMHAHERAREALDAFHAEFSNNGWPGLIARAESQLRERDFAAALATYEAITSEYGSDPEAHALAAYVHGLLGDRDAATAALQESIRRELQPGMYTRLWAVLLATQEHRPAAEAELRDFVDNAPQSVSAWDRTLGRFVLGAGGPAELLDAARLERGRRVEHGEPLADLMCEVWFYVGLRHEAAEERTDALAAYREVLSFRPRAFKWEWAYARLRFADLVQVVGCTTPGPTGLGLVTQPEREAWHVPRSARWTGDLGRSPRPGDLQLAVAVTEKGERRATLVVFGAN
jgi:tetratricopeptide (TPR) repeat protein